jgi:hypothetical protein
VAALLWRICLAEAQGNGPDRSATRHRHFAQLPLLRTRLHHSWRRRPNLPTGFAAFAAYGDFATGLLAMLALLTVRIRSVFWPLVVAFNLVGAVDIIVDYYHGNQVGLAALAGELGATYAIPIIYVPLLMITHVAAFYLLLRQWTQAARTLPGGAAAVDGISG